jgi:hypothetical protein
MRYARSAAVSGLAEETSGSKLWIVFFLNLLKSITFQAWGWLPQFKTEGFRVARRG